MNGFWSGPALGNVAPLLYLKDVNYRREPYTRLMTDEFKALEEVARTAGKTVDAGREFGGFLSKYVGGTLEQAMGIFEDKLKYLRWELQVKLMQRSAEFLHQRGLTQPTRKVPLQIAIPLMQAGSLEENDDLRDRWAALLVNAADASSNIEVTRSFITILEDLTPLDASILEKIYSPLLTKVEAELWTHGLPESVTEEAPSNDSLKRPPKQIEVSLGNLGRLGLIHSALAWGGPSPHACITRTPLGFAFIAAISNNLDRTAP